MGNWLTGVESKKPVAADGRDNYGPAPPPSRADLPPHRKGCGLCSPRDGREAPEGPLGVAGNQPAGVPGEAGPQEVPSFSTSSAPGKLLVAGCSWNPRLERPLQEPRAFRCGSGVQTAAQGAGHTACWAGVPAGGRGPRGQVCGAEDGVREQLPGLGPAPWSAVSGPQVDPWRTP